MPRVRHERRDEANPIVYFDVAVKGGPTGTEDLGRVAFELYNDIAPKVLCRYMIRLILLFAVQRLRSLALKAATTIFARPQRTFDSFAPEKGALAKAQACRYISRGLHSTGSSRGS